VEYAGDSAQFDGTERILRLRGDPQVTREGTTLVARDSLVYQERTDFVAAYGTPRVTGEGEPIAGETMFYDLANKRSSVRGAQTKITDNATWLVRGDVTAETRGGASTRAAASSPRTTGRSRRTTSRRTGSW
jgi:lipopolysaccharide export system protein LptA